MKRTKPSETKEENKMNNFEANKMSYNVKEANLCEDSEQIVVKERNKINKETKESERFRGEGELKRERNQRKKTKTKKENKNKEREHKRRKCREGDSRRLKWSLINKDVIHRLTATPLRDSDRRDTAAKATPPRFFFFLFSFIATGNFGSETTLILLLVLHSRSFSSHKQHGLTIVLDVRLRVHVRLKVHVIDCWEKNRKTFFDFLNPG